MEINEIKKEQEMEELDVINRLLVIMQKEGMKEVSQDVLEVFQSIVGMQMQLEAVVEELQGVREQLTQMQNSYPKEVTERITAHTAYFQEKAGDLAERLTALKVHFMDTAWQAVTAFEEKGREKMYTVLLKGLSGVKSMLAGCREKMMDVLIECEKTANQIDSIGDELKQIGNGLANVGRLVLGKGTKELPEESHGVGLTRTLNIPVKKMIMTLRKQIDMADHTREKINSLSEKISVEKEKRISVKEKLSQKKTESELKISETNKEKAKNKELCI